MKAENEKLSSNVKTQREPIQFNEPEKQIINLSKQSSEKKANYFDKNNQKIAPKNVKLDKIVLRISSGMKLSVDKIQQKRRAQSNFEQKADVLIRISNLIHKKANQELKEKQIQEAKIIEEQYLKLISEKNLKMIVKLQKKWKLKKWIALFSLLDARLKYRKNVLKELVDTEKCYIDDLILIEEKIVQVLKTNEIISEEDLNKIFFDWHLLIKYNSAFYEQMKERTLNITHTTKISDILITFVHFFKFYSDYIGNYQLACEKLKVLKLTNKKYLFLFYEITEKIENEKEFGYKDIYSFIIKPIQRLPKYVLFLQELIKHTEKDHPDYQNLLKAQQGFIKLNEENNRKLEKEIKDQKKLEISEEYHDQVNFKIAEINRQFSTEELAQIFYQNVQKTVTIYIFNDLILITLREEDKKILISHIHLNMNCFIVNKPSIQIFPNSFDFVTENQIITFLYDDEIQKNEKMNYFNNLISQNQKKFEERKQILLRKTVPHSQQLIKIQDQINVSVVSYEQKSGNILTNLTYYIIDISIGKFCQQIIKSYADCKKIQKLVFSEFKESKGLNFSQLTEANVKQYNSQQLIQVRQIQIEHFLYSLLQSEEVKNKPKNILQEIGLPSKFYQMANTEMKIESPCQLQQSANLIDQSTKDILGILGEMKTINDGNQLRSKNYSDFKSQKYDKKIIISTFLPDKPTVELWINKETKVKNLFDKFSEFLTIEDYFDFKFILQEGQELLRPLNDEENILFVLDSSFFQSFWSEPKNITFRKVLFFEPQIEQLLFIGDSQRLNLIYNQIKQDIQKGALLLTFQEYCLNLCLHAIVKSKIYLQQYFLDISYNNILDQLAFVVPSNILKIIKKQSWIQNIPPIFKHLNQQLDSESSIINIGKVKLAQIMTIITLMEHKLFSYQLFKVEPSDQTRKAYLQFGKECYMAINKNYIGILNEKKTEYLFQFKLDVQQAITKDSITIKVEETNDEYTFKSEFAESIENLILEYEAFDWLLNNQ